MNDIDRIIEGAFTGSLFRNDDGPIVKYAPLGETIPIVCKKCDAVFLTKNIGYIGYSKIYYGDDFEKCEQCCKKGHTHKHLKPDRKRYKKEL